MDVRPLSVVAVCLAVQLAILTGGPEGPQMVMLSDDARVATLLLTTIVEAAFVIRTLLSSGRKS